MGILCALVGAAAALVVIAGWRYYAESRIGRIELFTDDGPIVAQVLAELSDELVGEPFDLHTRAMLSLPAGEYRLRVTGLGRLSRTYRFAVNRGETIAHTISIDEGRLLGGEPRPRKFPGERRTVESIPFATTVAAIELRPGKSDLITWSDQSMNCVDGATGASRWDLPSKRETFERDRDPTRWLRVLRQGELVGPAADLDGDGWSDLVAYFQLSPVLLALSGKDGSLLWNHVARPDGPGGPRDIDQLKLDVGNVWGSTAGEPAMGDVDRDGVADFFVTVVFPAQINGKKESSPTPAGPDEEMVERRCTVAAISGRSGRSLWTHSIDQSVSADAGPESVHAAVLVRGARTEMLAFLDGTRWIGLDPVTGKQKAGPIELGFAPVRPIQHADLDGDGEPDLLAVGLGSVQGQETIHAFSIKNGRELWSEVVGQPYEEADEPLGRSPFPLVTDLDGDGKAEVAVTEVGAVPPKVGYRGVRVLDGRTGGARWWRAMQRDTGRDSGPAAAVVASDLDGDGTRELIVVSRVESQPARRPPLPPGEARIYVDALSGKDGRPLWWWSKDVTSDVGDRPLVWTPVWWGRGPDGWPLLAVPLGGLDNDQEREHFQDSSLIGGPVVHVLEASTGKERHVIEGLAQVNVADLDGDGLTDLWGEVGHELRAFRGEAPEAWRALGAFHATASWRDPAPSAVDYSTNADFDGDQIADVLLEYLDESLNEKDEKAGTHTIQARSGQDGHLIWKTELDPWARWLDPIRSDSYEIESFGLHRGDFDGDGTADVVVRRDCYLSGRVPIGRGATLEIQLLSGRTGRRLWSAGALPAGAVPGDSVTGLWSEPRATEGNGAPDLITGYGLVPGRSAPSVVRGAGEMTRLARVSGHDGRVLWDIQVPAGGSRASSVRFSPLTFVCDLNGDGALDLPLFSPSYDRGGEEGYTLMAVSLRDGQQLWHREMSTGLSPPGNPVEKLEGPDGPIFVVMDGSTTTGGVELVVRAFDGRDGQARWTTKLGLSTVNDRAVPNMVATNFAGKGAQEICVSFALPGRRRRIVVLDANGKERVRREVSGIDSNDLEAVDTNGDGRDELLLFDDSRLLALDGELKDVWSWPTRSRRIDSILPGTKSRPCEVVLSPAIALNGATGRPRWLGQRLLTAGPEDSPEILGYLHGSKDSERRPLLITNGFGATVCRGAIATDEKGKVAAARGSIVQPGPVSPDPRWSRPLPWVSELKGPFGPWGFLTAGGLAGINVLVPWLIMRMVRGRRRSFRVRELMMLPAAAAIPLMVYLTVVPGLPLGANRFLATDGRLFISGSLAGLPIVLCVVWLCVSLVRLRFGRVLALAALSAVASLALAGAWIWRDLKLMAAMEHYRWEGWWLIILLGGYAAAVLWVGGVGFLRILEVIRGARGRRVGR